MGDSTAVAQEIQRAIQQSGAGCITFAQFMELALYHPRFGYYTRPSAPGEPPRLGKAGDYFTSVSVGPLFGRLLARQFAMFREQLGNPPEFAVVEFGGQRGRLRADVLAATAPESWRYDIVEAGDTPPDRIIGCVFSNEFLDALPVHRVQVHRSEWQEIYVTAKPAAEPPAFCEVLGPLSTPRLADHLRDLPVHLMEGYRTEVNLRALDWLTDVAHRLRRGFVLTIDYGYDRAGYFAPHHRDGTLCGYYRHTRSDNPFRHVGEQDLTAHVEFTSLIEHGKMLGLEPVLFTDQGHYLLQIGEAEIAAIVQRTAGRLSPERQAIHQLIHPELMGRAFQVLIQRKR